MCQASFVSFFNENIAPTVIVIELIKLIELKSPLLGKSFKRKTPHHVSIKPILLNIKYCGTARIYGPIKIYTDANALKVATIILNTFLYLFFKFKHNKIAGKAINNNIPKTQNKALVMVYEEITSLL